MTKMNSKDMVKKMVKAFGVDALLEMAKLADSEIKREEAKYTRLISPYEYTISGHKEGKPQFPEWVDEILTSISEDMGIPVISKGSGDSKNLAITNKGFAQYIIYACNDDGETLRDILEVLAACPAWCKGVGFSRLRMELVFHMLVLHRSSREMIKQELIKFLGKYDQTTLRVLAALDDDYRGVLNREIQMIAYTEKNVISKIDDEKPKFEYAA